MFLSSSRLLFVFLLLLCRRLGFLLVRRGTSFCFFGFARFAGRPYAEGEYEFGAFYAESDAAPGTSHDLRHEGSSP